MRFLEWFRTQADTHGNTPAPPQQNIIQHAVRGLKHIHLKWVHTSHLLYWTSDTQTGLCKAWRRRSVGCTYLAGLARPLWRAETLEAVLHVDAGSTLSTRAGGTFIRVWNENQRNLMMPIQLHLKVTSWSSFSSIVKLWMLLTVTFSTGRPGPARRTVTLEAWWDFVARPSVGTRVGHTGVFS